MSTISSIEWTEMTWNPVTGCTKISPGCKHCYAERMSRRLQSMGVEKYKGGFSLATHESSLDEPLRWKKPRLVFVNSMSDLFHKSAPSGFIEFVFDVMNRSDPATRIQRAHPAGRCRRPLNLARKLNGRPTSARREARIRKMARTSGAAQGDRRAEQEVSLLSSAGSLPGLDLQHRLGIVGGDPAGREAVNRLG